MNAKVKSGYQMLLILSAIDRIFNAREDQIILQFLNENRVTPHELEEEYNRMLTVQEEDFPVTFNNAMNEFYLHSTPQERTHFLDLAVKMVVADHLISPKENLYLNELYNAWDSNFEDD